MTERLISLLNLVPAHLASRGKRVCDLAVNKILTLNNVHCQVHRSSICIVWLRLAVSQLSKQHKHCYVHDNNDMDGHYNIHVQCNKKSDAPVKFSGIIIVHNVGRQKRSRSLLPLKEKCSGMRGTKR